MTRTAVMGVIACLIAVALAVIVDRASVPSAEHGSFKPLLTAVSATGKQLVVPARVSSQSKESGPVVRFSGQATATGNSPIEGTLRVLLPVEAMNPFTPAAWPGAGTCARVDAAGKRRSSGVPRVLIDTLTDPPTPWFECVVAIPGREVPMGTGIPWQWTSGDLLQWDFVYRMNTR